MPEACTTPLRVTTALIVIVSLKLFVDGSMNGDGGGGDAAVTLVSANATRAVRVPETCRTPPIAKSAGMVNVPLSLLANGGDSGG